MRGFLIDENLPAGLPFALGLPVFDPVHEFGPHADDTALWNFAKRQRLVLVTKDADFSARILPTSPPPWVVQLRVGNMRRVDLLAFLDAVWPRIIAHLPRHKLVVVYRDRIEAVR